MNTQNAPGRGTVMVAAAAVGMTVLAACSSSSPLGIPPDARVVPSSRVDTLADELNSGLAEPRRLTARTDSAWTDLWRTIYETQRPRPELPDVDFDEHLVIVESPAKARTLGGYLGPGYRVEATVGHVRDLPESGLGVDVEAGFEPEYVTIKGKGKVLQGLRSAARSARMYASFSPSMVENPTCTRSRRFS